MRRRSININPNTMTNTEQAIEASVKAFGELMLDEYGKWRIDRNVAESFLSKALKDIAETAREECLEEWRGMMKGMIKQDVNLEPGFNITAEYRLGELRGYNQAIDDIIYAYLSC